TRRGDIGHLPVPHGDHPGVIEARHPGPSDKKAVWNMVCAHQLPPDMSGPVTSPAGTGSASRQALKSYFMTTRGTDRLVPVRPGPPDRRRIRGLRRADAFSWPNENPAAGTIRASSP